MGFCVAVGTVGKTDNSSLFRVVGNLHTPVRHSLYHPFLSSTQSASLVSVTCPSHAGVCVCDPGIHCHLSGKQGTSQEFRVLVTHLVIKVLSEGYYVLGQGTEDDCQD